MFRRDKVRKAINFLTALFFLFSFGTAPAGVAAQAEQQAVLVIEGGTLIDGNGGQPVRDSLIVIRGNRIETVSRKGAASYPAGAQVLHADGKFILPGLTDSHVHYQWWMPELFLNNGVTTAFVISGIGSWELSQREAIERGKIPGPRLFISGQSFFGNWRPGLERLGHDVIDTPEKARELIRKRTVAVHADMANLHRGLSFEVWQAAVDESHKAGLPVVGQSIGPIVFAKEAALAGTDILEHASGISYSMLKDPSKWSTWGESESHSMNPTPFGDMDDAKAAELIRLLVDRHVALEPDLISQGRGGLNKRSADFEMQDYRLLMSHGLTYVPEERREKDLGLYREFEDLAPAEREKRMRGYQNELKFLRQFVQAGGKVLAGTDASSWAVPGLGLHHEMEILAEEVGLTPMQAIQTATRNAAEAFRVLDRIGTIEPGKLADLIVVNQDPLQDIRNLHQIEWVIKDGKTVDRTYHPWFKNPLMNSYLGSPVESSDWVAALKQRTSQGIRAGSGLTDEGWAFGQPTPGIETISPDMVTEGAPTVSLTLRGVNFTKRSLVYLDNQAVPTQLISETELRATIDASYIAHVGTLSIRVKSPGSQQQSQWGDGSNTAHLLVNFRY
jgi:hypothetical protein